MIWRKYRECTNQKTGVGCDGFHPKVPLDLTTETRGEIVEFSDKVEQTGRMAATSMHDDVLLDAFGRLDVCFRCHFGSRLMPFLLKISVLFDAG